MEVFLQSDTYVTLLMLTLMEIVLGIDNIVFITILCGRLPEHLEKNARRAGIAVALVSRLALLGAIGWVQSLTEPLFVAPVIDEEVTGRAIVLLGGGLFLIGKAAHEIFHNMEHPEEDEANVKEDLTSDMKPSEGVGKLLAGIMVQVIFLDIVFSLDSVITAVGMADSIWVMAVAMIIAVTVMLIFAGPVGDFVQKHPSVRILALAFLLLIGVMLVMEGTGQHVSKGYIYSAMGFALFVEVVNMRRRKKISRVRAEARAQGFGEP